MGMQEPRRLSPDAGGPTPPAVATGRSGRWLPLCAALALALICLLGGPLLAADNTVAAVATPAEDAPVPPVATPHSGFSSEEIEPLLQALEQLGFKRHAIADVFYDRRLRRLDRVVTFNAMNPDSEDIYAQFTEPFAMRLARRFLRKHRPHLEAVEAQYGGPKEILVGILLGETQFGNAKLPYRVLEVFTTLAVEGQPGSVDRHFARMRDAHPEVEKEWLASRLVKKAEFAFQELVAVLSMFRENAAHIYDVRGSYAGAIGMPQFLPSSYLRWAVDGNGDGQVDLNNLDDVLPSIANYLREHGWTPDAQFEQQWRSVWRYNNSTNYTRTIFEIALRLQNHRKR